MSATLRKQFGERAFGQVRAAFFSDDDNFGPTERAVPGYTMLDAAAGSIAPRLESRENARRAEAIC